MQKAASADERVEAFLASGGELLRQNKVEEARDVFLKALELAPADEKVLGLLGLTHFRLSDFAAAEGVYKRLVEQNPKDASYRLNLGLVHLKLGHAPAAIAELTRSRELDPSQIRTVSYLGLAYARNGEYARAYESFLRADQSALAAEMEQYLDDDARASIRKRVLAGPVQPDEGTTAGPGSEVARNMFGSAEEQEVEDDSIELVEEASPPEPPPPPPPSAAKGAMSEAPVSVDFKAKPTEPEPAVEPASAAPEPISSEGMITRAVDIAIPSSAASAGAAPQIAGHQPARPLSELATSRLIRPGEGQEPLEIGAGGVLIVRVRGQVFSRTERVMVSAGELGFEVATRRVRGVQTSEIFGEGDQNLFVVTGEGYLVASPGNGAFTAVRLDEDALYVREPYLFAFESSLRWESGRVPGSELRVVQFRGSGCVALRTPAPLLSVKISSEQVIYVESDVLAGWIGRVVPRLVKPAAGGRASTSFIECSGEGVVLIDERADH